MINLFLRVALQNIVDVLSDMDVEILILLVESKHVVDEVWHDGIGDVGALSNGRDAGLKDLLPLFFFDQINHEEAESLELLRVFLLLVDSNMSQLYVSLWVVVDMAVD